MSDPSQATISLTQRKLFVASSFIAQEQVTTAAPTKLANCFVMEPSGGEDFERLNRIATLADIDDVGITVNPLSYLTEAGHFPIPIRIGDVLTILAPSCPAKWGAGSTASFNIVGVETGGPWRIQIEGAFWTMLPAGGVQFSIARNSVPVYASIFGTTQRLDPSATLWKCDRYSSDYAKSSEALDHMLFTSTYVKALSTAASLDGDGYLNYAPGNPVITTFTG
jgi:hypothetical protein